MAAREYSCSKCGMSLESKYSSCGQCKSELEQPKHMRRPIEWKSEAITIVLSIILPGVGHIYIGQFVKGIVIRSVDIVITILLWTVEPLIGIAYFPLTIWACYDSYKLCKTYNNHIQQFGRPPKW